MSKFETEREIIASLFENLRGIGIDANFCKVKPWRYLEHCLYENAIACSNRDFLEFERLNYIPLYFKGDVEMIYEKIKAIYPNVKWNGDYTTPIKMMFS